MAHRRRRPLRPTGGRHEEFAHARAEHLSALSNRLQHNGGSHVQEDPINHDRAVNRAARRARRCRADDRCGGRCGSAGRWTPRAQPPTPPTASAVGHLTGRHGSVRFRRLARAVRLTRSRQQRDQRSPVGLGGRGSGESRSTRGCGSRARPDRSARRSLSGTSSGARRGPPKPPSSSHSRTRRGLFARSGCRPGRRLPGRRACAADSCCLASGGDVRALRRS